MIYVVMFVLLSFVNKKFMKTSRILAILKGVSLKGILLAILRRSLLIFFNCHGNCGVEFNLAL